MACQGKASNCRCTDAVLTCILGQGRLRRPVLEVALHGRMHGTPERHPRVGGDVPCGPVRTAAEVVADHHFWERGTLQPMPHTTLEEPVKGVGAGFPVVFSGGPLPTLPGAPIMGMHNAEVYGRLLGLSRQEIQRLHEEKVI